MESTFKTKSGNASNRFKALPLSPALLSSVKKAPKSHEYDPEYSEIDKELALSVARLDPKVKEKLKDSRQVPMSNRLGIPTPDGYTTYQQLNFFEFLKEFYNELLNYGIFEPKLLVTHANTYPLYPDFYPQSNFSIPKGLLLDLTSCKPSFERLWKFCRINTSIDDITIRAKKISSPGAPFQTYDGQNFTRKDVLYGVEADFLDPDSHLRLDYSKIKLDWIKFRLDEVFDNMMKMVGVLPSPSNVEFMMNNFVISLNRTGFRFNTIDAPIINDGESYNGKLLYGKERTYLLWDKDSFETGIFDTKEYATKTSFNYPMRFSPQRIRPINATSYITGVIHQIDAQLFIKRLENSKFGFLSEEPKIISSYKSFLTACNSADNFFITGDRINAELTITSNFDSFKQLIPSSHLDRFELFMTHIKFTWFGPRLIKGLLSGIGWTTAFNVIVGLYEAMHTISVLTDIPIHEVYDAYVSSFINDEDFVILLPFRFKLFLPTDDIPLVLNGPVKQSNIDKLIKQSKERLMEFDINKSGFVTFGQQVDSSGIMPAPIAQYSKLSYIERPGYLNKDIFSIAARFELIEPEIKDLLDFLLKKWLGSSVSFYQTNATMFLTDLQRLGLNLGDVFNEFSPKDAIIIRKFAGITPFESTEVVDPKFYERVFKELRLT